MKIQLFEKPTIEVREDSAVVLFPSRPYWFSASRGVVDLLAVLDVETNFSEVVRKIALLWEISQYEAKKAVQSFVDLLFSNGVLSIDDKFNKLALEIKPDFQVNAVENVLVIAATHECNLACPQCYVGARNKLSNEMTTEEIKNLVDMLSKMTWKNEVSRIGLTGGEFFCRKDAMEIVDYVHKKGFKILISTNSLRLDHSMIKQLAKYDGLKVSVSLDGPDAESHEFIRGKDTFLPTLKAIKEMTEVDIFVGVNMFIHQKNIDSIEMTLELAKSLGVTSFNCLNLMRVGRANSKATADILERVPEHRLYRILFDILKNNHAYRKMMKNSTFANQVMGIAGGVKSHYCGIGTNRALYIRADGNVYPCPDTALKHFLLGNIKTDSLEEIWNSSPVLENLRQLNIDKMNPICALCDVRYFCAGGCRGENYQVTKSLTKPHFNCEENRRTIFDIMWILTEDPEFMKGKVTNLYQKVCE